MLTRKGPTSKRGKTVTQSATQEPAKAKPYGVQLADLKLRNTRTVSTLRSLAEEYMLLLDQESVIASGKELILSQIREIHEQNDLPDTVHGPGWNLLKTTRVSKSLSQERLLELGVKMKTLRAATVTKESTFVQLKPLRGKE